MSLHTEIEFADRTANPQMGCESLCELSPTVGAIERAICSTLKEAFTSVEVSALRLMVRDMIAGHTPSDLFHLRTDLAERMVNALDGKVSHSERLSLLDRIQDCIKAQYVCYAHALHLRYARNATKPEKVPKTGYALDFQTPLLTSVKVATVARAPDLFGKIRTNKP